MTKELHEALTRSVAYERKRLEHEIYRERKRISSTLSADPTADTMSEVDSKRLSSLFQELSYCEQLLKTLAKYVFPNGNDDLDKKIMEDQKIMDDYIIPPPIETPVEKQKITRPTKEEQILFILRALISYHERMTMKESTPYDIYLESLRFAYQAAEEKIAAPAAPRPTDKDIERIRNNLDKAAPLARIVADHSVQFAPTEPLFSVETSMLLQFVAQAATEFNAVFPKK